MLQAEGSPQADPEPPSEPSPPEVGSEFDSRGVCLPTLPKGSTEAAEAAPQAKCFESRVVEGMLLPVGEVGEPISNEAGSSVCDVWMDIF